MTDSARPFEDLSPDLILNSAEAVAGERSLGNYLALNSVENRVLEVPFENQKSFVIKFYRPGRWDEKNILEEHRFIRLLAKNEIPVNPPVVARESKLQNWDSTLFQSPGGEFYFALFPKLRGRIKDEFQGEDFDILGRLLARIHLQGEVYHCKHRRTLNPKSWGYDSIDFLHDYYARPSPMAERYFQVVEDLLERIEVLWREVRPRNITIHGDCHIGNLLWNETGPVFLDFDDLLSGPTVQDLWMLLGDYNSANREQWDRCIEAYEEFRDFPRNELRLIPSLRALRMIHFSKWIAERWLDPSFPSLWPNFGTDPWWQEEIQALSEINDSLFD